MNKESKTVLITDQPQRIVRFDYGSKDLGVHTWDRIVIFTRDREGTWKTREFALSPEEWTHIADLVRR